VLINNGYLSGQGERKMDPESRYGKAVKSLLFARFIINRASSCKSGYELKTHPKSLVIWIIRYQ
jgi:hypothetical protein